MGNDAAFTQARTEIAALVVEAEARRMTGTDTDQDPFLSTVVNGVPMSMGRFDFGAMSAFRAVAHQAVRARANIRAGGQSPTSAEEWKAALDTRFVPGQTKAVAEDAAGLDYRRLAAYALGRLGDSGDREHIDPQDAAELLRPMATALPTFTVDRTDDGILIRELGRNTDIRISREGEHYVVRAAGTP
jgi:hypothetical protein